MERQVPRQHPRLLAQRDPAAEFARRFTGSGDLYAGNGRRPVASINLITAHDGFTLRDLVSYNDKSNEANLEENTDGADDNRSWNCGAEGETDDPEVNRLRARQQRNFLTTLFLSQGVPMLLGGDELGRTQHGNNNAWCQDNEISWLDWDTADQQLHDFVRRLIQLRHDEPVFRRRDFFVGDSSRSGLPDVCWYQPTGEEMTEEHWQQDDAYSMTVFLNGDEIPTHSRRGERLRGDSFLLLLNGHHEPFEFTIPAAAIGERWTTELTTSDEPGPDEFSAGDQAVLQERSLLLLRRVDSPEN